MAATLYLLRHGDTGANGRLTGSTDLGLAEQGIDRLYQSRAVLNGKGITRVFASPMLRCRQTVDIIDLGITPILLDDLREIDFGEWEGLRFSEIAARWPEEVRAWGQWSLDFTFPQGERIGGFLERLDRVRQELAHEQAGATLVVAHGGVIRHLLCKYLGLEPQHYLLFDVRYGQLASLELHSEGGILTSLNCG